MADTMDRGDAAARPGRMRVLWDWVWPILVGCGIAYVVQRWVVGFANVPSGSMYPTIPNPCTIVVNHIATEFFPIRRGEVVLFPAPDDPTTIYVKRVVGMPGETVSIHDGHVYINGKVLNEPYLKVPTTGDFGPYKVPANSYFMLGDNRGDSDDSRYWIHKFVPRASILGRADFVIWPLWKAGPIQQ